MRSLFRNYLVKLEKKEVKEFVSEIKKVDEIKIVKLYLGNSLYNEICE